MENITFGGNDINLLGEKTEVGKQAPRFKAVNNDMSEFNSDEYQGKVRIISVVPSLDTPVCDMQTTRFNKEAGQLGEGVVVITISNDLPFAQERYCSSKGIDNSIVVSDYKDLDFGKKYGFVIEENRLLSRGIIVIDQNNIVRYVEYVPEVTNHPDYDRALEEAKKLLEVK